MIDLFEHTFHFANFLKIICPLYKDYNKLFACESVNIKKWLQCSKNEIVIHNLILAGLKEVLQQNQ